MKVTSISNSFEQLYLEWQFLRDRAANTS